MSNDQNRLEYLNLEFSDSKIGGTIDHLRIACFHPDKDKFKHNFHVEGKTQNNLTSIIYQQNCISDLCYHNLHNLSAFRLEYDRKSTAFSNVYFKIKERISVIEELLKVHNLGSNSASKRASRLRQHRKEGR